MIQNITGQPQNPKLSILQNAQHAKDDYWILKT
jgi:hypothetical protein